MLLPSGLLDVNYVIAIIKHCFVEMPSFSLAWTPQYIRGASGHNVRTRDECSVLPFYVNNNRVKRGGAVKYFSNISISSL
jgi:hypothetical protein